MPTGHRDRYRPACWRRFALRLIVIATRPVVTRITVAGSGTTAVPKMIDVPLGPLTVKSPVGKKSLVFVPFSRQLLPGMQTAPGGATLLHGVGPAVKTVSKDVTGGPPKLPNATLKNISMFHVNVPELGDGPNVTVRLPALVGGGVCKVKNKLLPSLLLNCIACISTGVVNGPELERSRSRCRIESVLPKLAVPKAGKLGIGTPIIGTMPRPGTKIWLPERGSNKSKPA